MTYIPPFLRKKEKPKLSSPTDYVPPFVRRARDIVTPIRPTDFNLKEPERAKTMIPKKTLPKVEPQPNQVKTDIKSVKNPFESKINKEVGSIGQNILSGANRTIAGTASFADKLDSYNPYRMATDALSNKILRPAGIRASDAIFGKNNTLSNVLETQKQYSETGQSDTKLNPLLKDFSELTSSPARKLSDTMTSEGNRNAVQTGNPNLDMVNSYVSQPIGGMVPSLLTGQAITSGLPKSVLTKLIRTLPMGISKAGNKFDELAKKGYDDFTQIALGTAVGANESLTELIPFDEMIKPLNVAGKTLVKKGASIVGDLIKNALAEGIQEAAVSPLDTAAENIALGQNNKLFDLEQAKKDFGGGVAVGTIMRIIMSSIGLGGRINTKITSGQQITSQDIVQANQEVKQSTGQDILSETQDNANLNQNTPTQPNIPNQTEQAPIKPLMDAQPIQNQPTQTNTQPIQQTALKQPTVTPQYDIDSMNTPKVIEKALAEVEKIRVEQPKMFIKMNLQLFADKATAKLKELTKQAMKKIEIKGPLKDLSFPKGRIDVDGLKNKVKDIIDKHPLKYNEINNKDTIESAQKLVDESFDASKGIVRDGEVYDNAGESAVGMKVIEKLWADGNYDEGFDLFDIHSQKLRKMGQSIQIAATWARATPEGMVKYIDRFVKKAKERGIEIKVTKEFKQQIYEEMKVIQDIGNPKDMINKIVANSKGKLSKRSMKNLDQKQQDILKEIAVEQVLNKIVDTAPVSIWRKISTFQAIAHLLNATTTMRNLLGNTSFNEAERTSNVLGIPIDRLIALKTGEKTLAKPTARRKTLGAGVQRATEASTRLQLGLPAVSNDKYKLSNTTFKKGLLGKAEKLLAYELQVTDEFQKGIIVADVIDQFKRLRGSEKVTEEMTNIAQKEAEYRTFQDDSLPAEVLGQIGKAFNLIGGGKSDQKMGKHYIKEFGLKDLTIKYTRVAGNIISRTVEYTPMGYVKSLINFAKAEGNLKNQRTAAMAFGRATNGSIMLGMGAVLRMMGFLVKQDDDTKKNESSLDKAAGLGTTYKLNITAMERALNGESTKLQKDDYLTTYDWLQPVSKSFSIGAAIHDEIKKGGNVQETAVASLDQGIVEILDLSMLSVVKSMTYAQSAIDVLLIPVTDSLSGFIPSPIRQTSNALDPFSREQYTGTPLTRGGKRIQATIPFAKKKLEPSLDPFGKNKTTYGTGGLAAFNQLLNPGNIVKYNPNEFNKELKALEVSTGLVAQYPISSAPKIVTIKKVPYNLTDKEKTAFMKLSGSEIEKKYREYFANKMNSGKSDATKVKNLRSIVESARDKAGKTIINLRKE